MRNLCIIFAFILSILNIYSQVNFNTLLNNSLLENANISLLVKDLSNNKIIAELNPKNSLVSASTMKLVTTSSALEILGADFQFETKLCIEGKIEKDSTLNGNLYIIGGGDPTLGSSKIGDNNFLTKWVFEIRKAGINKITGKIIADISIFEKQVINPKWTWEDMGNYYAAGTHGIAYLDNTFTTYFNSHQYGSIPDIVEVVPEINGLEIDNNVKSTTTKSDNAYFYGAPYSSKRSVYGEIPANKLRFPVKGDIPNPGLLLAQVLQKKLNENGIKVSGTADYIDVNSKQLTLLYTHYSAPLNDIITQTNIHSNNLFAEYLFKYLGIVKGKPATTEAAKDVIRKFWNSQGLPVQQLFQCDGSGLSPANGVSAEFFVDLLTYMKTKSTNKEVFYNSLPVSGTNGTLKNFLSKSYLSGKVHAKSGTIERVKSYAGYIENQNSSYVFAILINNANGSSDRVLKKIEDFLLSLPK